MRDRAGAASAGEASPGRISHKTTASTAAQRPGTTNRPGQPPIPTTGAIVSPASQAPTTIPAETTDMIVARNRSGASSADSAVQLGKAAPRPIPVSSRQTRNSVMLLAVAVPSVASPTPRQPNTISGRRPIRSPSGASNAAPAPRPTNTAENTMPKPAGSRPRAAFRCGTASGIALRSYPSITNTSASRTSDSVRRAGVMRISPPACGRGRGWARNSPPACGRGRGWACKRAQTGPPLTPPASRRGKSPHFPSVSPVPRRGHLVRHRVEHRFDLFDRTVPDLEGFGKIIAVRPAHRARSGRAVGQRVFAEPARVVDEAIGEHDAALDVDQRKAAGAQLVVVAVPAERELLLTRQPGDRQRELGVVGCLDAVLDPVAVRVEPGSDRPVVALDGLEIAVGDADQLVSR